MAETVTVTGVPQLMARLRAMSPEESGTATMEKIALTAVRESKLLVHRKTGNLGRSIHVQSVTPTEATVVASAGYAAYVEFGTRGGTPIVPVRARVLAWPATAAGARLTGSPRKATLRGANGGMRFAMRVIRGATRPFPYMVPGALKAMGPGSIAQQIVNRWNEAG
jgi:hypothetical protein